MGRPVKVYKCGRVECAIFHNDKYDSFSFKFQKSYQDKNGDWQNTDFFADTDMGDLGALVEKFRAGRIKEKGMGKREEPRPEPKPDPSKGPEDWQDDIPF